MRIVRAFGAKAANGGPGTGTFRVGAFIARRTIVRRDAVEPEGARQAAEDAVLVVSALGVEALAVGRRALREVGVSVVIARSQVTDDARLVARCGRG